MTRLLVLGMLDMHPMSGYDVKQMLQLNDAERWAGVLIGSIYHALKKLEKEGHIEITSIEHTGHRQKAIYQITDQGRSHLHELVVDTLSSPAVVYPSSLYSGLSLSHKLDSEEALDALNKQQAHLEEERRALQHGLELKNATMHNTIPPMTKLIFDHMFTVIDQQQVFINKAINLLENDD
ncbi:PadR family transcriptional regulator [Salipaludibacillus agaradhaerens]|uniref:PadR family transcriptional regulator n=1 Tax=Salipaludibacillus agaradhaerens TaxID=76935 RepID=A0A9Q4G0L9_SALAG|nr:PadR family transcriptional regulator [Salipaludibacillus agaradhaerens]MCR6098028.1 PadR family transcriptional regulator [Salipaludibacillus agaradhaerens]MCR6116343.1 PadR family transcriptional regulator [Salipaludibacillus agaradhaerens]